MEDVLRLVETYGITLVLLLASVYALYKFFVFSIYEVKGQFSKYHENNAKDMQYIKSKIDIILEFIKDNKKWKDYFVTYYIIWVLKKYVLDIVIVSSNEIF